MNLDGLHPIVRQKAEELLKQCSEENISITITEGYRSIKRQNELYAQGRTKPGEVVTQVKGGGSYHNYGLAIDYALMDADGNTYWNENDADWSRVAAIGKKLGFAWGGDWDGFKDYPHLEMTFGLSTAELKAGAKPPEEEEILLNPDVAINIIDSYLTPEWRKIDEQIKNTQNDHHTYEDLVKLRDWQHTLANELRRAAKLPLE